MEKYHLHTSILFIEAGWHYVNDMKNSNVILLITTFIMILINMILVIYLVSIDTKIIIIPEVVTRKFIISKKKFKTYTDDNKEGYNLDPWVQWVSVHTGKKSKFHCFNFSSSSSIFLLNLDLKSHI